MSKKRIKAFRDWCRGAQLTDISANIQSYGIGGSDNGMDKR